MVKLVKLNIFKIKFRNIFCKLFDHKWLYSFSGMYSPIKDFRACKRCGCIDEYRMDMYPFDPGWFRLVSRTKFGAEERLKILAENAHHHAKTLRSGRKSSASADSIQIK